MKYSIYKEPRTNHSHSLYLGAFGEFGSSGTILDVGAGDSEFASIQRKLGSRVIALDPQYAIDPPLDPIDAVIGDARSLPFSDHVFDRTVSAFMVRQLPHGEGWIAKSIEEMVRVTKPGVPEDGSGVVSIFPVYRSDIVNPAILDLGDLVSIGYPNREYLANNHPSFVYPTLTINKLDGATDLDYQRLAELVEEGEVFRPYMSLGRIARYAYTLVTGKTKFNTPD